MGTGVRKIDKEYVLSDSAVNEYGFRLLTSGYQLPEYAKNPIGFYMHKREQGVLVSWTELAIKGDKVVAKPVINLANERGEQSVNEIQSGFLNAASMGHFVVLEYSTDASMMLPGQTGPTITKWYNRECSLVDIPGNYSALTELFDANNNAITLQSLKGGSGNKMGLVNGGYPNELYSAPKSIDTKKLIEVSQTDYTLYAALVTIKSGSGADYDKSKVDAVKLAAYVAEHKRMRLASLSSMTKVQLTNGGLWPELERLDKQVYVNKMQGS